MADQLDMNGLSLHESQHAGGPGGGLRSAYVPPHARRGGPPGPPPPMNGPGGMDGSAWGPQGYDNISKSSFVLRLGSS